MRERWYEKLHEWDKALEAYKRKESSCAGPIDPQILLGQMRCVEALGEWSELHSLSRTHWDTVNDETRQRMARMSCNAAWGKKDWSSMLDAAKLLPRDSQDGAFYRAVLSVHNQEYENAQKLIDLTKDMLDTELTALSAESYQRAYPIMIQVHNFIYF